MKNDKQRRSKQSDWAAFGLIGQVGLYISAGALLGIAAGLFIDNRFHTSPLATLIGLLLGLAAGIYMVYRLISSLE
ncbi:MAG TPA: AtpZ/AtpI family protein [Ktedonobacterales bacterium]|jgi:ATP synthase protein I|nr:AtpZ/AtpI family protein [Ktedonobacterales bacterium]